MSPDDGCFGRLWNLKKMEPHKGKSALWTCLEVIARPYRSYSLLPYYCRCNPTVCSSNQALPVKADSVSTNCKPKTRRKPKFFSPKLLCVRHGSQHWKRNSCVLNGYCITSLSHRDNISILKVLASKIFLLPPPGC